jgi:hypothetical protein
MLVQAHGPMLQNVFMVIRANIGITLLKLSQDIYQFLIMYTKKKKYVSTSPWTNVTKRLYGDSCQYWHYTVKGIKERMPILA